MKVVVFDKDGVTQVEAYGDSMRFINADGSEDECTIDLFQDVYANKHMYFVQRVKASDEELNKAFQKYSIPD